MKKLKLTAGSFTINEDGIIQGYASVFDGVDCYNDSIERTAYDYVVKAITDGKLPMPKMFFNHAQWCVPIGNWLELTVDNHGLHVKGQINRAISQGEEVYQALKFGSIDGLSVCIMMEEEDIEVDEQKINHIKNVRDLTEISICTFPADKNATIYDVKSELSGYNSIKDVERLLRDVGNFSKSDSVAIIGAIKSFTKNQIQSDSEVSKSELSAINEKIKTTFKL